MDMNNPREYSPIMATHEDPRRQGGKLHFSDPIVHQANVGEVIDFTRNVWRSKLAVNKFSKTINSA